MRTCALAVMSLFCHLAVNGAEMKEKMPPNIVMIVCDGLKATALGAYGAGQVKTPNLDRLAEESAVFENAYVQSPSALPAFASLLTGRYPQCHGLMHFDCHLKPNQPFLTAILGDKGYWTGAVGQLAGIPEPPHWAFRDLFDAKPFPAGKRREDGPPASFCGVSGLSAAEHPTALLTDKALAALDERAADPKQPFFLCVSYAAPGYPCLPPAEFASMYDPAAIKLPPNAAQPDYHSTVHAAMLGRRLQRPIPTDAAAIKTYMARYFAEVSFLDDQVGRLIRRLRESGALDNTIVVFTSLRGDFAGEHGAILDGDVYDALTHVPLMIRFPEESRRGKKFDDFVEQIDVAPTVLTAALDTETSGVMQGVSLIDHIDNDAKIDRRFVFSMLQTSDMPRGRYLVRNSFTTFILDDLLDRVLMFDMSDDPLQVDNVVMRPERQGLVHTFKQRIEMRFTGECAPAAASFLPSTLRSGVPNTNFPDDAQLTMNIPYASDDPRYQNLDLYRPVSDKPTPVLIEFHGGGFRGGDKLERERTYPGLFGACLQNGIAVVAANYRLRPEYDMGDIREDCAHVIQFVRLNAEKWNIDPTRVALIGGSAGAAASAWFALSDDMADPDHPDPLKRQSTRVSGWIDCWGPMWDREDWSVSKEVSPDDPPVLILHDGPPDATSLDDPRLDESDAHNAYHGIKLKQLYETQGLQADLRIGESVKDNLDDLTIEFMKKAFEAAGKK